MPLTPTRKNCTNEFSSVAISLAKQILELKTRSTGDPTNTIARLIENMLAEHLNGTLELLAAAITSDMDLETATPVLAVASRGSITQAVASACYEARTRYAKFARELKAPINVMPGRRPVSLKS